MMMESGSFIFHQVYGSISGRERVRELFGLYVSSEVAQAAVEIGGGLGGELVNCSMMFSDIRDFTTLSEQMPPRRLVELINRYMTAIAMRQGLAAFNISLASLRQNLLHRSSFCEFINQYV